MNNCYFIIKMIFETYTKKNRNLRKISKMKLFKNSLKNAGDYRNLYFI